MTTFTNPRGTGRNPTATPGGLGSGITPSNPPPVANQPNGIWTPTPRSTCFSAIRVTSTPRRSTITLDVEFRQSGSRYRYSGVGHDEIVDLVFALSMGKHYNNSIKGHYISRRL